MSNYSKSHERDENRKMNKGLTRSLFGLALCWLPVVGLLLAMSGFLRVIVRVTDERRRKKALLMVLTLAILAGSIGVLGTEIYHYTRNPEILQDGIRTVWHALTGQEELPWAEFASDDEAEGLDPEDPYGDYGYDPYEDFGGEEDEEDSEEEDYEDENYEDEDYDEDFDDSELESFEEEEESSSEPAQIDLFNQMRNFDSKPGVPPIG